MSEQIIEAKKNEEAVIVENCFVEVIETEDKPVVLEDEFVEVIEAEDEPEASELPPSLTDSSAFGQAKSVKSGTAIFIIAAVAMLICMSVVWFLLFKSQADVRKDVKVASELASSAKGQSDSAVEIAKSTATLVGDLESKVKALDVRVSDISLAANYNVEQNQARFNKMEETVAVTAKTADEAKRLAASAARAQAARVQAENGKYKRMMAYIRANNPTFPGCSKSDSEINRLLSNGKWDIEEEIQSEYDRIIDVTAKQAKFAAENAAAASYGAEQKVNQAIEAGETAVSAVKEIAQQSNVLSRSVSNTTKRKISEKVAAYIEMYGDKSSGPAIKGGAPEQ